MASDRATYIAQLIDEGYSPERALRYANEAFPRSGPVKAVDTTGNIVHNVLDPVEYVTRETSSVVKTVAKHVFFPWKS